MVQDQRYLWVVFLRLLAVLLVFAPPLPVAAKPAIPDLTIVVPGAAGGGFDKTAQALSRALRAEGLVGSVSIQRSPGAGGLIALAQFESLQPAASPTVFIGGSSLLGAAVQNRSVISLSDIVPICQLNEIALVVAVSKSSPVKSLGDLLDLAQARQQRFAWVGGSLGSPDYMLLLALMQQNDLPVGRINYTSAPGGGSQVPELLLQGNHLAAISSYEEFAPYARNGAIRLLAVSSGARIPGVAVPTFREAGVDMVMTDWKGVFLSNTAPIAQQRQIAAVMTQLLQSESWKRELRVHGWRPPAGGPAAFSKLIAADKARANALLEFSRDAAADPDQSQLADLLQRPWRFALIGFAVAAVFLLILIWQRRVSLHKRRELERALRELQDIRQDMVADEPGERSGITRQLHAWGLSTAEIEIAWMILKGLNFKEIAGARGTSERTVRQQAQAIYAKSDLAGRAEFSAYFLENLRF